METIEADGETFATHVLEIEVERKSVRHRPVPSWRCDSLRDTGRARALPPAWQLQASSRLRMTSTSSPIRPPSRSAVAGAEPVPRLPRVSYPGRVLRALRIRNLRGIRSGEVTGLTRLNVFVGPNGCGKTTVLEAAHIGTESRPLRAFAESVARSAGLPNAAKWLFPTRTEEPTRLEVDVDGDTRAILLTCGEQDSAETFDFPGPYTRVEAKGETEDDGMNAWAVFNPANQYALYNPARFKQFGLWPKFVGPVWRGESELHRVYSEAVQAGLAGEVQALARAVVPGTEDLRILTDGDLPVLHAVSPGGSVPVAVCGDGAESLVRQALQLAAKSGTLVLLEEPEAFKYPRAVRLIARAIWTAVARGVQVMLTTHSLELIDALIAEEITSDLASLSLFRLSLAEGILQASRMEGPEVKFERRTIESDLR